MLATRSRSPWELERCTVIVKGCKGSGQTTDIVHYPSQPPPCEVGPMVFVFVLEDAHHKAHTFSILKIRIKLISN